MKKDQNHPTKTHKALDAAALLGTASALSTESGRNGPPDIKDISLRWLAGTVLTGVTSITLMGGALMAAVDTNSLFSTPQTVQSTPHLSSPNKATTLSRALIDKADRPVRFQPSKKAQQVLHLSTLTRSEDGNRVRTRPFGRLDSSMLRFNGDPRFDIPAFDPVTIFSGSSKFREKGGDDILYNAQVDDEIEIRRSALETDGIEEQATRGLSDEEVESKVRERVPVLRSSLDDGTIFAHYGAIAYADPKGLEPQPTHEDTFSAFDELVTIRSENVSTISKTNKIARLETAGLEKVMRPKSKRSIQKLVDDDLKAGEEASKMIAALSSASNLTDLTPQHELRMSYAGGPKRNNPDVISLFKDNNHITTIARSDSGDFIRADEAFLHPHPNDDQKPRPIPGQRTNVYKGIFETALKHNLPTELARELIRIYAFDVDFHSLVKEEDGMEVFYSLDPETEEATAESEILYTSLTLNGQKRRYYRFKTTDDGAVDYYDENGRSAKKFLMRQPVPRAKFRSGYGWRRHPILRTSRLHKGVDWSARRGTPIFAAGNGVVEDAKWFAGYGRWIKIQHANGYETGYAHMSRFAKGIRPGVRVRQGQIIGYVGSTGLSTGPHLHYEVIVNGRHVDPMRIRLPRGRVLKGKQLAAFESERNRIDQLIEQPQSPLTQDFAFNRQSSSIEN